MGEIQTFFLFHLISRNLSLPAYYFDSLEWFEMTEVIENKGVGEILI